MGVMMKTIADFNDWRGKASLDDGEWTTFVDPDGSPDFFKHMSDIVKVKLKGQLERAWPKIQALAKMAGYKVTKAGQAKGRTFRFDLKK